MLQTISSATLIERLEHARDERTALAFDADGTLWSGDIGIELFQKLLREEAVRGEALSALKTLASQFALTQADEPNEQARALYQAFVDESLPDRSAFAMMAWAFAGFSTSELDAFVAAFLAEARIASRLQAEVMEVLAFADRAKLPVYVVSASPRAAVVQAVELLSIPPSHVVAMTPGVEDERILPWVNEPMPYAEGKVAALQAATGLSSLLGAFGDSGYDLAMLSTAIVPVAVRPKASLLARANELPHLVSLLP